VPRNPSLGVFCGEKVNDQKELPKRHLWELFKKTISAQTSSFSAPTASPVWKKIYERITDVF
jgi:hypothetical protein